jgi:Beta-propeller repeat
MAGVLMSTHLRVVLSFAACLLGVPASAELLFVPNEGQTEPAVQFMVKTPRLTAYFMRTEILFAVQGARVRFQLLGADPSAAIRGGKQMAAKANFFLGNRPEQWRSNVPVYAEVQYRGIYPGVDLVYGGVKQRLKSDFLVAAGADPSVIRFRYSGVDSLRVDAAGTLELTTSAGTLREEAPEIYQQDGDKRTRVEGRYAVARDGSIGFKLGRYDHARPLIIDPLISYSTYFGGSGLDNATGVAVDASGNSYMAGWTDSQNLATVNPIRSTPAGVEAFVAKLSSDGKTLLYSTYIGGNGEDRALGIALDTAGNVYLTGSTTSTDFPVVNAYQSQLAGGKDAFVLKLNPSGNGLVYSTYYGGHGNDIGNGIAINVSGNAYITGETLSADLPLYAPYQSSSHGLTEIFVAKFLSGGNGLVYSTYIGGRGDERGTAIAVDAAGAAYVTGSTTSPDFTTLSAFQPNFGGIQDAFVLKLAPTGSWLLYSTYLGGSGGGISLPESGAGIAVDSAGNAYVAGTTSSFDFPLANAMQSVHSGSSADAFVTKLNAAGNGLIYSTYLGGSSIEIATAIAVDTAGTAYVTGYTASTDFPSPTPDQARNNGSYDGFISHLAADGSRLLDSVLLGGSGSDAVNAVTLRSGEVYVAGQTSSGNFPTNNPLQPYFAGSMDAFVTKYAAASTGWRFVPIVSCRVVDTRGATGPLGGPVMAANSSRDFPILSGLCGIPATALAYSLNVTVIPRGFLGYISLWPTGGVRPTVSTLNSYDGRMKSNAALLPAGSGGSISLYTTNATDVLIDINGYFVPPDIAGGLVFYPITPCRILDTRNPVGTFGGPSLAPGGSRALPIPSSACGVPASAGAYALNVTVVPWGQLSFLTVWPTGSVMPSSAILTAPTGMVTANAAIVKAGTGGSVNISSVEAADLVIDINGYFAAPGTGGLSYYAVTPCRLVDTRNPAGPLGGPTLSGQRDFPLSTSSCGVPASATAYSLNVTVVPPGTLGWLMLWPTSASMPTVSTLNSLDGSLVANAAIIPVNAGWLSAFAVNPTELILDLNGYFAP